MNVDLLPLEPVLDLYRSDFQLTYWKPHYFSLYFIYQTFFPAARHDFIFFFEEI
jgi:hypothetical protein